MSERNIKPFNNSQSNNDRSGFIDIFTLGGKPIQPVEPKRDDRSGFIDINTLTGKPAPSSSEDNRTASRNEGSNFQKEYNPRTTIRIFKLICFISTAVAIYNSYHH